MIRYPFELSTTQRNHVGWLDVRQNDTGTQQFVATITTNDVTQDLTGLTAEFRTRQNNENVIIEKATISNGKNGVVEYIVSQYAMQQLGKNIGYFTFSKGDVEMFSTKDFCYYVNTSVTTFGLKGCDYIWRFEDLLEYVTGLANQSQVQLDKLINDVADIQQQIDDMFALIASQGVLSADEVRQLLIKFMSGEDIEVTIKSDFNTPPKVAGSIVENGNIFKRSSSPSIQLPSGTWVENTQENYDSIMKLDESVSRYAYMTNGAIASKLISYNALWILEKNFPSIFKNTTTIAEKVAIAKSKIKKFQYKGWAKASGPTGTLCNHSLFNPISASWGASTTSTGSDITQRVIGSANASTPAYLNTDGFYYFTVYAEPSNGTIASSVSIDYTSIELTLKFNINEFVPTRKEFDTHVADTVKHITATERTTWNGKQNKLYESGLRYPTMGGGATSNTTFRVNYEKVGRSVSFGGRALLPSVTATQIQIASVPLEFAPQQQKFFEVTVAGRQTDLFAKIVIDVDGIIYCYFCNSTSQYFVLDGINYLTKD